MGIACPVRQILHSSFYHQELSFEEAMLQVTAFWQVWLCQLNAELGELGGVT